MGKSLLFKQQWQCNRPTSISTEPKQQQTANPTLGTVSMKWFEKYEPNESRAWKIFRESLDFNAT